MRRLRARASGRAWPASFARWRRSRRSPRRTRSGHDASFPTVSVATDAFLRVLLERKTHRDFSTAPLPLATLAALLHYTWGAMGMIQSPNFGPLLHKTSPSGGARHPGEVYVAALRVKGLAKGIVTTTSAITGSNSWEGSGATGRAALRAGPGARRQGLRGLLHDRGVSADDVQSIDRRGRIASSRWRRATLAQTFCMVATWLGLAPFTTAAVSDTAIERALGLDGVSESMMYVAGVGMPPAASGQPLRRVGEHRLRGRAGPGGNELLQVRLGAGAIAGLVFHLPISTAPPRWRNTRVRRRVAAFGRMGATTCSKERTASAPRFGR